MQDKLFLEALRREYTCGLWWLTFIQTWATLAEVLAHEQNIASEKAQIAAIRAKYMRPGRPVGWRKPKAEKVKPDDRQTD